MNLNFLAAIVSHTPVWVWGLLAALVAIGLLQTVRRQIGLRRATLLPFALLGWSLFGVVTGFRADPSTLTLALLGWATGVAAAVLAGRTLVAPHGARWLADMQRLDVPGSWLPLMLIVGLFAVKYAAGAGFAMHPQWAAVGSVAAPVGLVYGVFSGLFLARSLSLWSLARQPARAATLAAA